MRRRPYCDGRGIHSAEFESTVDKWTDVLLQTVGGISPDGIDFGVVAAASRPDPLSAYTTPSSAAKVTSPTPFEPSHLKIPERTVKGHSGPSIP